MNYRTGLFMNIAKSFGSFVRSGALSSFNNDGYPTGTLSQNYSGNVDLVPNYYGHYTTRWMGTAGFVIDVHLPTIVYSGGKGVYGITPSNVGTYAGSPTFINNGSQNIEWAFGTLVTGVSNDATTGNLKFSTIANGVPNPVRGLRVKLSNLTGLPAGPNTDGSWTITVADAQTFILESSSTISATSLTLTTTGGPGVQTDVIIDAASLTPQISIHFPSSIPIFGAVDYNFSNFVWCKTVDLGDIDAGYQISRMIINQIKALNPKYVRFMDVQAVQSNQSNINYVSQATSLIYDGAVWNSNLIGTGTTNTGDAFTCDSPPASSSSAYVDGEIVQWTASATTNTGLPTLQLGTRGAAPIWPDIPFESNGLHLGGTTTNGNVIVITFTASYLPGGAHTVSYTVNSMTNGPAGVPDDTIVHLSQNLSAALAADNTMAAAGFSFGDNTSARLVTFLFQPSKGAISVSVMVRGTATETLNYQRLPPAQIVSGNSYTCIYSVLMGGWIMAGNTPGSYSYSSGYPLTIMAELCNRSNVGAWFCLPILCTSESSLAFGQWSAQNINGPVCIEYGNEVWNLYERPANVAYGLGAALALGPGVGSYYFAGMYAFYGLRLSQLLSKFAAGYMAAGGSRNNLNLILGNWAADGSNAPPSNGFMQRFRWNGQPLSPKPGIFTGTIRGTTLTVSDINGCILPGWTLSGLGVSAGTRIVRARVDGNIGNGTWTVDTPQNVGPVTMTVSNPVYSSIGGFDGGSTSASYNALPNRPIDLTDAIAYAVYYYGALTGDGQRGAQNNWYGLSSIYDTLFRAAADYASGNPISMQNALNALDDDIRHGTRNGVAGTWTIAAFLAASGPCQIFEDFCAQYDGARPASIANLGVRWYESSLQVSFGLDGGRTDIANSPIILSKIFARNGWTLHPTFGSSNLDVATKLVTLFLAYVNSKQYYETVLYLWTQANRIHAARRFFSPSQYGVEGPSGGTPTTAAPLWGMYPGDATTRPLQNYFAEQDYNLN